MPMRLLGVVSALATVAFFILHLMLASISAALSLRKVVYSFCLAGGMKLKKLT